MTKGLEQGGIEPYSLRLREERRRVEPSQQKFAKMLGISKNRQCQLETGRGELRADYLAAVAKLGLDSMFIITGRPSCGPISNKEMELLTNFRNSNPRAKDELLLSAKRLRMRGGEPQGHAIALEHNLI